MSGKNSSERKTYDAVDNLIKGDDFMNMVFPFFKESPKEFFERLQKIDETRNITVDDLHNSKHEKPCSHIMKTSGIQCDRPAGDDGFCTRHGKSNDSKKKSKSELPEEYIPTKDGKTLLVSHRKEASEKDPCLTMDDLAAVRALGWNIRCTGTKIDGNRCSMPAMTAVDCLLCGIHQKKASKPSPVDVKTVVKAEAPKRDASKSPSSRRRAKDAPAAETSADSKSSSRRRVRDKTPPPAAEVPADPKSSSRRRTRNVPPKTPDVSAEVTADKSSSGSDSEPDNDGSKLDNEK